LVLEPCGRFGVDINYFALHETNHDSSECDPYPSHRTENAIAHLIFFE